MAIYQITEVHPESAWCAPEDSPNCIVGTIISSWPASPEAEAVIYKESDTSERAGYYYISGITILNSKHNFGKRVDTFTCYGVKLKLMFR